MAGNNSCGARSIRYGKMVDNVKAISAVLSDGTRHDFGPLPETLPNDPPHSAGPGASPRAPRR